MKLYIDLKYISLLSSSLRNFKDKGNNLFNFSCPLCGDSKKDKTKARGYAYERKGSIIFHCHNCKSSLSLGNLIKHLNQTLFDDYCMERFLDPNISGRDSFKVPKKIKETKKIVEKRDLGLTNILELEDIHPAKKYVLERKIPLKKLKEIFYVHNFKEWAEKTFPDRNYKNLVEDDRIVLPYFDSDQNLIGAQGRAIQKNAKVRYVSIKKSDDDPFIFGLNNWNKNEKTFVTEGPIDSMFLNNCVAVSCSDLGGTIRKHLDYKGITIDSKNIVCVFDNEKRNENTIKMMLKAVRLGFSVVVWPDNFTTCKDINDMILSGKTRQEVINIIEENHHHSLSAEFIISNWKM